MLHISDLYISWHNGQLGWHSGSAPRSRRGQSRNLVLRRLDECLMRRSSSARRSEKSSAFWLTGHVVLIPCGTFYRRSRDAPIVRSWCLSASICLIAWTSFKYKNDSIGMLQFLYRHRPTHFGASCDYIGPFRNHLHRHACQCYVYAINTVGLKHFCPFCRIGDHLWHCQWLILHGHVSGGGHFVRFSQNTGCKGNER